MMNETKIMELLNEWEELLVYNKDIWIDKVSAMADGLDGRLKRTNGHPVVFDADNCERQQRFQGLLSQELPELMVIIHSVPDLMDGFAWTRGDYIDLYFEYYQMVIEKLRRHVQKNQSVV